VGATPTPVWEHASGSGAGQSTTSSITTISAGVAVADPVTVAWQLEDLQSFPPDYASSLARKIGITLPASDNTLGNPRQTSAPAAGDLSTGAKAGIGIGAAIGAAVIGISAVLLCLRKRRKAGTTTSGHNNSEMEDQDLSFKKTRWYFGGKWRSEVAAEPTQNELDSKAVHVVPGPPAELEAA